MIRVGTMLRCNGGKGPRRLESLLGNGFESYQFHWWADLGDEDLLETSRLMGDLLAREAEAPTISLALYGNLLREDHQGQAARNSLIRLIDHAQDFGASIIGCFTGRLPGRPWDDSLPRFRDIFSDLCTRAADHGLRLAMENCPMGGDEDSGDWNLAFHPVLWQRLFDALPSKASEVLGLEWEPAHQIVQGYRVLKPMETWLPKIFHIHGKDARVEGMDVYQTLPGNGRTDWLRIFSLLEKAGYRGSLDIEGYHDAQWSGQREIPGQLRAMEYLKACRESRGNDA